jgi:hypothetical protein
MLIVATTATDEPGVSDQCRAFNASCEEDSDTLTSKTKLKSVPLAAGAQQASGRFEKVQSAVLDIYY